MGVWKHTSRAWHDPVVHPCTRGHECSPHGYQHFDLFELSDAPGCRCSAHKCRNVNQRGSGGGRVCEAISALLLKDLLTFVPLTLWHEAHRSAATRADVAPELNVASNMIVDRTNASDAVLAQLANGTADPCVHTVEDALVAIEDAAAVLRALFKASSTPRHAGCTSHHE